MEKPFPAYNGEDPYVFVCYAHDDEDVVFIDENNPRQPLSFSLAVAGHARKSPFLEIVPRIRHAFKGLQVCFAWYLPILPETGVP